MKSQGINRRTRSDNWIPGPFEVVLHFGGDISISVSNMDRFLASWPAKGRPQDFIPNSHPAVTSIQRVFSDRVAINSNDKKF